MIIKGGIRWLAGVRFIHCSRSLQAVEKATLSKLRKKTGFPFVNCKKALEKFDGDIAQAEKWLREEAQKEGWAKATKLQGRPMSQGLVGVIVDSQAAAMVEVNCETDFVARNPMFQSLVSKTAALCLRTGKDSQSDKVVYDQSAVNALSTGMDGGQKLADLVALEVGNIGENMAVRRALYLRAPPGAHVGTYVHSAGPHVVKDNKCTMGRYGALVSFTQTETAVDDKLGPTELGRQLGQHIVGMNPQGVGTSREEDSEGSGDDKKPEEESMMIHQEFLLEPSLTVQEFLQQNSATVLDFARFQCGEELGEEGN